MVIIVNERKFKLLKRHKHAVSKIGKEEVLKRNKIASEKIKKEAEEQLKIFNLETNFIQSNIFQGKICNYVFKIGDKGLGYYFDLKNII